MAGNDPFAEYDLPEPPVEPVVPATPAPAPAPGATTASAEPPAPAAPVVSEPTVPAAPPAEPTSTAAAPRMVPLEEVDKLRDRLRRMEDDQRMLTRRLLEEGTRPPVAPTPATPADPEVDAILAPYLERERARFQAEIAELRPAVEDYRERRALDAIEQVVPGFRTQCLSKITEVSRDVSPELAQLCEQAGGLGKLALLGIALSRQGTPTPPAPAAAHAARAHMEGGRTPVAPTTTPTVDPTRIRTMIAQAPFEDVQKLIEKLRQGQGSMPSPDEIDAFLSQ